jgi:hypothetical protein
VITLSLKDSGAPLGTIDDADMQVLRDQLEEESETDTDYFINAPTIELLEQNGASAAMVAMLRAAAGDSEGVEIAWSEA